MAKVGEIIGGAVLVAGIVAEAVILGPAALAAMPEEFTAAMAMIGATGASLVASGVAGLLAGTPAGQGVSSTNPIKPWDVVYGQVKVPGTIVYDESNGGILSNGSNTYDKCFQAVYMLACHPIKSIDQVRMGGKEIPLGAGGSGSLSTEWTYTPSTNQGKTYITSAHRTSGVVTIKLNSDLLLGQNGQTLSVQNVYDNTFNGQWIVTQPNPADNTTFTYQCGGPDTTPNVSGAFVLTCLPDYKNRIHVDRYSCLGNHTSTFPELLSNSSIWTTAHLNRGRASCYIAYYYDANVFAQGVPQSSFVISGKNNIYDPRIGAVTDTAAYGYTTNAALIIADYLTNTDFGYGLIYGTDVPLAQLISAANICDEQVPLAAGGNEARYAINMTFDLSRGRGEVLQDMLGACGGRITIQSGQYTIIPGAWVGPSISLAQANLIGPVEYKPIMTITDSCNGVKGTYTSPVNNWQSGDIPPYCEDVLHKYTSDRWLAADGGVRIWKDVNFPATTSCPTAQRLAKIELERTRREGRLTLHCDMSAYPAVALDVVEFTYPRYGWVNKTFEILSSQLVLQADANGGPPTLGVDLDLAETDSTVYDWSTTEELTPTDTPSPAIANGNILTGPQFLELESGAPTTVTGADGVCIPRILAAWLTAPDAQIQSGGYIAVEYQKVGDTLWTPVGQVSGTQTQCYIQGVVSGSEYSVQIQGFTAKGISSGWVQAGPVMVSATATNIVASSVTYPDGTPVSNLQPAEKGADGTANQPIVYGGIGVNLISNGNFIAKLGIKGWAPTDGSDPAGLYYFAGIGTGVLGMTPNSGAQSPTFALIPGHKYRFEFTGASNSTGTNRVYHRVFYSGTYNANTQVDQTTPFVDFLAEGNIPNTVETYTYDWVAPAGAYYASLAMYQLGDVYLYYTNVTAEDYSGVGEWGADVTLTNTSAGIVGQGALATLSTVGNSQIETSAVNTQNIIADAVNSHVVYRFTTQVNVPALATTPFASTTLDIDGGYAMITCMVSLAALTATTASVYILRGNASGPVIAQRSVVGIPSANNGWSPLAIQAIDVPGTVLAQEYTVVVQANNVGVSCNDITLLVENAKV